MDDKKYIKFVPFINERNHTGKLLSTDLNLNKIKLKQKSKQKQKFEHSKYHIANILKKNKFIKNDKYLYSYDKKKIINNKKISTIVNINNYLKYKSNALSLSNNNLNNKIKKILNVQKYTCVYNNMQQANNKDSVKKFRIVHKSVG